MPRYMVERSFPTGLHIPCTGRLLQRARAILFVMGALGMPWSLLRLFAPLPTRVLDWFYDRVARNRYRLFGKRDACRVPTAEEKLRFLG